jgi:pyruvate,water dikinase
MPKFIRWLHEIGLDDIDKVGGKNASLGEMMQALSGNGIAIPGGFAVTAEAYDSLIGSVRDGVAELLSGLDKENVDDLSRRGLAIRQLVKRAGLPSQVAEEILSAYSQLGQMYGTNPDVAVRSSATAEDLPEASFAGQQETFLNVRGEEQLLDACLDCFASLFTDRAIAYRIDQQFDHLAVRLSVGVQKMVRSDLAASGVIFTLDPESGFRNVVLVTSAYGLGENIVAGRVDPDEFLVFKPTLKSGHKPIIRRKIGEKQSRLAYCDNGQQKTENLDVPDEERKRPSLSDQEVLQLARWAVTIEEHYSQRYGRATQMDIEWAKDGVDGRLYIVQARPETVHSVRDGQVLETYRLDETGRVLLTGRAVGTKIGTGKARVIRSVRELGKFQDHEVLVTDMTDPDWEPVMKRASAIVTNRGGRTCHAAIVSREIGVPCLVGTEKATRALKTGREITVSCAEGVTGHVYDGPLKFSKEEVRLDEIPRPRTKLLLNLGNPEQAFSLSALPVDGVGLAREEFIIANEVRVHPLALTRFDSIKNARVREQIHKLIAGYDCPEEYFIQKLSEGIGMIAAAFYPREIIVRLSDFKSNEYANLIGGSQFEPGEENPMIGFRGAARYYSDRYRDGFRLECLALKRAREDMGLTNIKVMVPFCRTPDEGRKVIGEMAANGLEQGKDGLEVYVMCELPSNVLGVDMFAEVFDGFSIGSNDLTQLVLGIDRDSEVIAHLFDERDEIVKRAIAEAIAGARRKGRPIGICGQAPSDYPEVVKFLVEQGINSVSVTEDAAIRTLIQIAQTEKELGCTEALASGH